MSESAPSGLSPLLLLYNIKSKARKIQLANSRMSNSTVTISFKAGAFSQNWSNIFQELVLFLVDHEDDKIKSSKRAFLALSGV